MPDQTLGIILQAQAQNAAAYDQMIAKNEALKKSSSNLNVIYGTQGQVLSDLSQTMSSASSAHADVTNKAKAVASAERDVTAEGREAAKAFGELGSKGGELFERFSSLAGMMGSGGGLGLAMGGALVGLGALVEAGKAADETYHEQQQSIANLKQATDASGTSFEDLNSQFEAFANQNASFISNENDARTVLADFVRAGIDSKNAMTDLGIALDLAALKHEDLTTAGNQTLLMLEGNGKVAKTLGIDIAALKTSTDNASTAQKEYAAATKTVAADQDKLATANEALKVKEDELSGKRKVTKADLDELAAKQAAVKKAADDLTTAQANQKKALDDVNKSASTQSQIQSEMQKRLADGRRATDEQQQAANRLAHEWDQFSAHTGPALDETWTGILNGLSAVLGGINDAINALNTFSNAAEASLAAHPGPAAPAGVFARQGLPNPGRASGGPVYPGGVYTVGESGPETLTMGAGGGFVTPGAGGSGGMDDTNELLAQMVMLLSQVAANTRGSTFTTGAWNPV